MTTADSDTNIGTTNPQLVDIITEFYNAHMRDEIAELAQRFPSEQQSLLVDTAEVGRWNPELRDDMIEQPVNTAPYFVDALHRVDLPVDVDLRGADVRFTTAIEPIGVDELRIEHINQLVRLSGQISKITPVRPQVENAAYECRRCGVITHVPQGGNDEMDEPHQCSGCERQGPFRVNHDQSEFEHSQRARLTTPPEDTTTGDEHVDVHLTGADLVGEIDAGQRVDVIGVVHITPQDSGSDLSAVHDYIVEAHAVEPHESDYQAIDIEEHQDAFEAAAADPDEIDTDDLDDENETIAELAETDPFELLINSIAPSISGGEKLDDIRLALGLQAFGGWRRPHPDGQHARGDSHICLIGDPGTGKSSLLDAIEEIVPRSAYTSGKNTTSAGLTAAVVPDDFGGSEWSMEAGVVRANGGVACVDEIDKVHDDAKSSLHTALEKQIVPVNKAGISADLPAQTAMLAAGNPKYGRFDRHEPIGDQINLDPAFASRFDLIFTLKDHPNPDRDEAMAEHVLQSRQISGRIARGEIDTTDDAATLITPTVEPDTLRAWIAHARENYHPIIPTFEDDDDDADDDDTAGQPSNPHDALKEYFVDIRGSSDQAVPLTARKLGAILRLAEASARVRLSNEITVDDIERALQVVGRSLADVGINEDGELDADIHELGHSQPENERIKKITNALDAATEALDVDEIAKRTTLNDREMIERDIQKLRDKDKVYGEREGEFKLVK